MAARGGGCSHPGCGQLIGVSEAAGKDFGARSSTGDMSACLCCLLFLTALACSSCKSAACITSRTGVEVSVYISCRAPRRQTFVESMYI